MDGKSSHIQTLKYTVTPDNVNHIFDKENIPKEIDMLSIDIDSYDY